MTLFNFLLIICNTLALVCGQLLWKTGLQRHPEPFRSIHSASQLMISPYILGGVAIYGLATILWLFILSRVPLSLAYPIQSLAYIFAIFGGYIVFQEPLSLAKIGGSFFILAGVMMIGWRG